jgi:hypothetical protein
MILPFVIGGLFLTWIGKKVYDSKKGPPQAPIGPSNPQDVAALQAAQLAAIAQAHHAAGGKPAVNPQQALLDKALAGVGMRRPGSYTPKPAPPPRLVLGDPLMTQTGKTYYVTIALSMLGRLGAGRDTIVQEAQNHGFTNVMASPVVPAGWPGSAQGDWYVRGTAMRPSQFDRQKGVMTIVEGYEQ